MTAVPLFSDPTWADAYTAGEVVSDGIRSGVVVAVLDDNPGGVDGRGLVVDYGTHVVRHGFDHTFSDAHGWGSDAPAGCSPAGATSPAAPSAGGSDGAGGSGGVAHAASAAAPRSQQTTNSTRPLLEPAPGA